MTDAKRPVVLVTEGSAARPLEWLRERAEVREVGVDAPGFEEALRRAEGMVVRTYTRVDAALLDRAPRLRVVGRGGVGLESIDVAACRARGVEVVYTPDANTTAVAELVGGLLVQLVRPWHANDARMFEPGGFKKLREDAGEQLCDLTLGVLGMGRVGRAVARVAGAGFGMRVRYHDVREVSAELPRGVPWESVSFDDLLGGCDVLTVHVDGRPGNRNLIDDGVLRRARFRWLINTSRGLVVDPAALAAAMAEGRLAGLALDVYEPEPPAAESAYAQLVARWPRRVVLTPHMASRTRAATENMSWVVRDVMAVLEGRAPQWPAP